MVNNDRGPSSCRWACEFGRGEDARIWNGRSPPVGADQGKFKGEMINSIVARWSVRHCRRDRSSVVDLRRCTGSGSSNEARACATPLFLVTSHAANRNRCESAIVAWRRSDAVGRTAHLELLTPPTMTGSNQLGAKAYSPIVSDIACRRNSPPGKETAARKGRIGFCVNGKVLVSRLRQITATDASPSFTARISPSSFVIARLDSPLPLRERASRRAREP